MTTTNEHGGAARCPKKPERALEELTAERDLLAAVLHSMDAGVLAVGAGGQVVAINRSARELLSTDEPVTGRSLGELVRDPALSRAVDSALGGESVSLEVALESRGSVHHLLARATPRAEGAGAILVMHEARERRGVESMAGDFVANVSHELRTPVSIIQANAETLLSGALDDPQQARRFLDAMRRNAERLSQLISDLLDISRIEAGQSAIVMRPVSMRSVARSVHKAVSEACRRRGVVLETILDSELSVWADAGALEQVLVNLIENAVTYGPPGGCIELRAVEEGAAVRIEIRDEGPGIAPEQRARVFERFYRVDPGRSRQMGGTGLGLAIVENLATAMGGDVGVEAGEPTGAVFWVRLSRVTAEAGGGPGPRAQRGLLG